MKNKPLDKEALNSLTNQIDASFDTSQMEKSLEIATKLRSKGAISADIFEKIQSLSKRSFTSKTEYSINLKVIEVLLESELNKEITKTRR